MRRYNRKEKRNSRWFLVTTKWQASLISRWLVLTVFLASIFLAFLIFKANTLEKFIYLNRTNDDGAEVTVIDSKNDKIIKYLIPADSMLDSANGYGSYKLSSLWKLSEKDETSGKLVSETILKNFLIPVPLWKNGSDSNMNLFQRIKVSLTEKKNLDISASITSKKLSDTILVNFVNSDFLESAPMINIDDLTGDVRTAAKVSKIVETIGGKVASNSKGYDEELNCVVEGNNLEIVFKIADIFNCSHSKKELGQIDISIRLGAKFAERF